MAKGRTETWAALVVVGILLIPVALLGLWGFMKATATVLHPSVADIPSATGSAPAPARTEAAERGRQLVRAALTEQNLPGLSVAVGVGGDIVWAEGFGWADLETRVPVAPETLFRIGTASTPLTSAAVGLLLEQGALDLDEGIKTYVPAFEDTYAPTPPERRGTVTLRHLMANVAGVPNDGDEAGLYTRHCARPVDALQYFSGYERELLFTPGSDYYYSSYGWIAVSAAVETAAGEPFLTFMQRRIFEPLGMRSTTPESAARRIPNRATFYFPRFAADPRYGLHGMRPLDYSCFAGASAFLSTPSDLVRFGMAVNGGALLKPATVQLLQTPQRLTSGEETGYGLGWDVEHVTLAGMQTHWVGHEGTTLGGMAASLMTFPGRGIVVAVMSNISYADTETLALKIAEAFTN
ncbi:MAG: beta-lactamase family protein [Acidimicrobiia bacterium]|nr:beta-lactamase family protein [Acidimicrobiia bacterium]